MPSAQITVAYKFPPDEGKKMWKIKSTDGDIYRGMPNVANKIEKGGTYNIEYKLNNWQGTDYKNIDSVTPIVAPVSAESESNTNTAAAAARFERQEELKAERIFVCGCINSALTNGSIAMADVQKSVIYLRNIWANTFGNKPKEKSQEELNDSIPF